MQINYCNNKVRRATPGFWYPPNLENSLQAMDVPPIYAPYGTYGFWPNATVRNGNGVLNSPDTSLAPNSAKGNTVAAAAIASGFGDAPPAASPAMAGATGQSMGPITLVAPMPSITPSPQQVSATAPAVPCNSMDSWVIANPTLAALSILGVFFLLGGRR